MGNKMEYGIPKDVLATAWENQQWSDIRVQRDARMAEVDWTQTLDCPLPDEKKAEFADYRQALRDIPQTYSNPDDVVWPTKPTI
ncbi:phage tail assembly chaperone [Vibrio parahaemolyticus]|nr:phage tail assembly chaperone [Vibrio parahaemolyticus]